MNTVPLPSIVPDVPINRFPTSIHTMPAAPMTQDQFFDFCQQHPDARFERTAEGELIIMAPSGGGSGRRNLSVGAQLYNWTEKDGTGEAFDSSTGFILPNGANRSPDAAWVLKTRLAALSESERERFLPLCPDHLTEMLSPTDRLPEAQRKMEEYIDNGLRLGWLIDPMRKQVHVYRPGRPVAVLDNPQTVSGGPELPGFVLELEPVWRP